MRHLLATLCASLIAAPAMAALPQDGTIGMQPPVTRIAERIQFFHDDVVFWIIAVITAFVALLLIWVIIRYNRKANPVASKFSHNTLIEVIWTVFPALILVAIAGLSFPNLYYQDVPPNLEKVQSDAAALLADGNTAGYEQLTKNYNPEAAAKGFLNIKVQGNQWNWTYTYADVVDADGYALEFVSNPVHVGLSTDPTDYDERPRNLAVDYPMVVPVNRYVRFYTAAADVIHSFAVPAFGIKTDAVPGRLNEGWFLVKEQGVFYGQCSELCGVNHAYMPIEVRVVSQAEYDAWAALMLTGDYDAAAASVRKIASLDSATQLASNDNTAEKE